MGLNSIAIAFFYSVIYFMMKWGELPLHYLEYASFCGKKRASASTCVLHTYGIKMLKKIILENPKICFLSISLAYVAFVLLYFVATYNTNSLTVLLELSSNIADEN